MKKEEKLKEDTARLVEIPFSTAPFGQQTV
jgi:hypothetical protein